jgi:hypothetical protein
MFKLHYHPTGRNRPGGLGGEAMTPFDATEPTDDQVIGSEVISRDGMYLGTAKAVEGYYFKLDAAMQPDYWLSMDTIASVIPNRIALNFDADRLADFALSVPRAA